MTLAMRYEPGESVAVKSVRPMRRVTELASLGIARHASIHTP